MYWIIIANTNLYKIYEYKKEIDELTLLKEDADADCKKKDTDLVSDGPGHYKTSMLARGAYSSHADAKKDEIDHFLKSLVHECESGRTNHQYKKIILLASPGVDGILSKHLNKNLEPLIANNMKHDCSHLAVHELHDFIRHNWRELHDGHA